MTTKHEVIAAHRQHPDWTARDIADYLGCLPEYVRATARRNNLALAKERHPRVQARIPTSVMSAFIEPARERGLGVHELAALLLERIAADGMIDAVLDDRVAA